MSYNKPFYMPPLGALPKFPPPRNLTVYKTLYILHYVSQSLRTSAPVILDAEEHEKVLRAHCTEFIARTTPGEFNIEITEILWGDAPVCVGDEMRHYYFVHVNVYERGDKHS